MGNTGINSPSFKRSGAAAKRKKALAGARSSPTKPIKPTPVKGIGLSSADMAGTSPYSQTAAGKAKIAAYRASVGTTTPKTPKTEKITGKYSVTLANGVKKYFDSVAERSAYLNSNQYTQDKNKTKEEVVEEPIVEEPIVEKPIDQKNLEAALKIIDDYEARGILPPAIADLYRTIAEGWDPSVALNAENVIKAFKNIRDNTIDPYLQGITNLSINNLSTTIENQNTARDIEKESEAATAKANIMNTKEELAQRGLTFTGESVKNLGSEGAYAGMNKEGTVQQANRMVASSSLARYKESMQGIGAKAEAALGTSGLSQFTNPYYTAAGGVQGDIETEKQRVYGNTFQQLIDQQKKNALGQESVDYNFNLNSV